MGRRGVRGKAYRSCMEPSITPDLDDVIPVAFHTTRLLIRRMIMAIHGGKCPKCENTIANVYIQPVDAKVPFSTDEYKAVSYQCPSCRTILSVQMDPIALKISTADLVASKVSR